MKAFSSVLTIVAGIAIAPYLVGLTDYFIPSAPDWFPYAVVVLMGGIVYAVGVGALRPLAAAMVIGVVLFGVGMTYVPQRIDFFGVDTSAPF